MFTSKTVALPSKKRALVGRRLVAVDIENVAGGAIHTAAEAVWARIRIEEVMSMRGDEHIVIGTSHVGLLEIGLAWSGQRYVVRSGFDGADLALLDVLEQERIADRFDEVFLVRGMASSPTRSRLSQRPE